MQKGLQAGFGASLGADLLYALRDRGVALVRLDLQHAPTGEVARALVQEVLDARLRPLGIIRPEQAAWFADLTPAVDLELLNEPDLAGWAPAHYRVAVETAWRALEGRHRLWAGSVSNCTHGTLGWLMNVVQGLPAGVGVTVHRYPKNGGWPDEPQAGFRSREDELARIVAIMGARPWGCSEFGYHTGPQARGWWLWRRTWRWTDLEVARFVREDWGRWAIAGAAFAVLYQVQDGPGADPIDQFGIRRRDGTWKPVADTFREEGYARPG